MKTHVQDLSSFTSPPLTDTTSLFHLRSPFLFVHFLLYKERCSFNGGETLSTQNLIDFDLNALRLRGASWGFLISFFCDFSTKRLHIELLTKICLFWKVKKLSFRWHWSGAKRDSKGEEKSSTNGLIYRRWHVLWINLFFHPYWVCKQSFSSSEFSCWLSLKWTKAEVTESRFSRDSKLRHTWEIRTADIDEAIYMRVAMRSGEVQGQEMCWTNHDHRVFVDYSFVCFHFQSEARRVLFVTCHLS